MRTITWNSDLPAVEMIDQNKLPGEFSLLQQKTIEAVAQAIQNKTIQGTSAVALAAVYGLVLAGFGSKVTSLEGLKLDYQKAASMFKVIQPKTRLLPIAIETIMGFVRNFEGDPDQLRQGVLENAEALVQAELERNLSIAKMGAELINDGDRIIHHGSTGGLASIEHGTALGIIRYAWQQGKRVHVFVDESRPAMLGSRLAAWEFEQAGIPYDIIADGAAGYLMRSGKADKVLFGAERVAMNGDIANCMGTYMLSVAAYDTGIPAYCVFPSYMIDPNIPSGLEIMIENSDTADLLNTQIDGHRTAPESATAVNFAFDITPHRLISGLITEKGVFYPPFFRDLSLAAIKER